MILPVPWTTCKGDRLCDCFDTSLQQLLGRRTVGEYERVHQLVIEGQARARTWFTGQPFPESAEEFLDALRALHGALFEEAVPRIAGRFRVGDEAVTFGGSGAHALAGVPCDEIAARLRSLHALLVQPCAADRAAVAGRCARFLEVFFRVHPFLDGNGRVGRFVILWYCEATTRFRFMRFSTQGKLRRRYFKALQHAHRHAPRSPDFARDDRIDPYRPLAAWLERHMEEVADDLGAETPPAE
jgi:fido (protein-threonine AMPylation protein)